jgi:uncharacterized repeat protein (TIGR03803 family)
MNCTLVNKSVYICSLAFALVTCTTAQTVTVFHNFSKSAGQPGAVMLAQGRDTALYGTTFGLPLPGGSVFRFPINGSGGVIHAFDRTHGAYSVGGLTLATDGNFYGTTSSGGSASFGVLFRVTPSGDYTVLHEFMGGSDGAVPYSPPMEASDGNLYGTTSGAGTGTTNSTAYKYTRSGTFSTIYQFNDSRAGSFVAAGLIQGLDGNLYGAAEFGGTSNCGTIFKISRSGTLLKVYSFPCDGGVGGPFAALVQASDGNFYGTTTQGGIQALGTVFKLDQQGHLSTLYTFGGNPGDAKFPAGLTEGTDGNLYGVGSGGGTSNDGALFRITTGGTYTLLYSFSASVGQSPAGSLLQHTNGPFYGTAEAGGAFGLGSIYRLDMGLGSFITFVQPTGKVSQTAQILGQGLIGTTTVTFNGVPATSFKVASDTFLTAVVPSGATTGPVVVTTPGGTLTSNKSFTVSH